MNDRTVGLLGIGLLGSALAERFIRAGFSVWGYDTSPHACHAFTAMGGQTVARAADVAVAARHIVLSLPDSSVVQNVMVKIIPHLQPQSVVIDTTTGTPDVTRTIGEQLSSVDIELVDACVLGSSELTRRGNAALLVGATAAGFRRSENILKAISDQIHHVGGVGSGQKMKLVANLVLGLNRAALAEGLSFADSLGLDPETVLPVLQSGAAASKVMDSKGRKMIDGDFAPQARLSQHLKDVNLILDHAEQADRRLPLSEVHRLLLKKVADGGGGDLDNSAIIQAWQHRE